MNRDYTITDVRQESMWRSNYALTPENDMVNYSVALSGEQDRVILTQKVSTQPPQNGDQLHGYTEVARTPNGPAYKKFKKVNPKFGGASTPHQPATAPESSKLDYIVKMLEELTGRRKAEEQTQTDDKLSEGITLEDLEDPFGNLL